MINRELIQERVGWLIDWVNTFESPVEREAVAAATIAELLDSEGILAQLGEIRRLAAWAATPEQLREAGMRPQKIERLRTEGRRLERIGAGIA
jgi:hypothetical protein